MRDMCQGIFRLRNILKKKNQYASIIYSDINNSNINIIDKFIENDSNKKELNKYKID